MIYFIDFFNEYTINAYLSSLLFNIVSFHIRKVRKILINELFLCFKVHPTIMVSLCRYATLHDRTGSRLYDRSVQENYSNRFICFDFELDRLYAACVSEV